MTEPRRWLDDGATPRELRELLASAAAPPPLPPALNARLSEYAATLAAQGVLAKLGGASFGHKLVLLAGSSGKAIALLSLVGAVGALGVGAYVLQRESAPSLARSEQVRAQAWVPEPRHSTLASEPASISASPQAAPSGTALGVPGGERTHQLTSPALDTELAAPAAVASASESSIAGEAKLLGTARSFLDDSPALALEVTEQHRRKYPVGQLSAEREVVAIEALLRLGRRHEAERRAAPMLEADPDGLYARRLRKLLSPAASKSENL